MTCKVMLVALMFVTAPALAAPQPMPDADQKLLAAYTPTIDKLQKYEAALAKMNAACRSDPSLAQQSEDAAAHPGETMDKAITRVGKSAIYTRFLKPAGLDAQDAVLLPLVVIGAGAVVEMHADVSKLPGLSQKQVDFYRAHRAEIGKMKLNGECEDEERGENPED